MKLTKKVKIELLVFLILLNIILRLQVVYHEIGWDSFSVHIMANSLTEYGFARWWVHPLSIVGTYPYSEPSAVPFLLSGISQCTNVNIESVIFLYGMTLGFFGIFAAYLMAGAIWNNDIFKFLVAFIFSTCQGIVTYTTWTAPTRTLFVILLPLFIYLLLRIRTFKARFVILTFFILVLLFVTHPLVYFTIPIIISYFIIVIVYKLRKYLRISRNIANFVLIISCFTMFLSQFFTRTFMEAIPRGYEGSRYEFLLTSFLSAYVRYIGVLIIFVVGGYIYLSLKRDKGFEEWFLLIASVCFAPLLYIVTYMKWVIPFFAALLIGIGLTNVVKASEQKKKYTAFVVIVLLFSVIFTGYYQYLHFLNQEQNPNKRYIEERTYIGALWIRDNIDKVMIGNDELTLLRVFAVSEVPALTGFGCSDLIYGFANIAELNLSKSSPFSIGFYKYGPYVKAPNTVSTGWYVSRLNYETVNSRWGKAIVSRFNFSYYVENMNVDTKFARSVQQAKNNLYDNGKIRVWSLD